MSLGPLPHLIAIKLSFEKSILVLHLPKFDGSSVGIVRPPSSPDPRLNFVAYKSSSVFPLCIFPFLFRLVPRLAPYMPISHIFRIPTLLAPFVFTNIIASSVSATMYQ